MLILVVDIADKREIEASGAEMGRQIRNSRVSLVKHYLGCKYVVIVVGYRTEKWQRVKILVPLLAMILAIVDEPLDLGAAVAIVIIRAVVAGGLVEDNLEASQTCDSWRGQMAQRLEGPRLRVINIEAVDRVKQSSCFGVYRSTGKVASHGSFRVALRRMWKPCDRAGQK
jgi:hypothetical protein